MPENFADRTLDCNQLRHDFANDIGSLKMNVEAFKVLREDPEGIAELTHMMHQTLNTLERRLTRTLDAMDSPEDVA